MAIVRLTEVLSALPVCVRPQLAVGHHSSLSQPRPDPLYIAPPLQRFQARARVGTVPIVLIAAPGAVGKSALAKQLAADRATVLWDLSQIYLGDNSFSGTLVSALGPQVFGDTLVGLNKGKALIVFDAFDEAELRSGWPRVAQFVRDLWPYVQDAPTVAAVLLARSETATQLDQLLLELSGGNPKHDFLEIGYFDESEARRFVQTQLAQRWNLDAHEKHAAAFGEALDSLFEALAASLGVSRDELWHTSAGRTFFGYAPVLQAIAYFFSSVQNFHEAAQRFAAADTYKDSFDLLAGLISGLLEREQAKFVTPLEERLGHLDEQVDFSALYPPQEQLHRVIQYVVGEDEEALRPLDNVPAEAAAVYAEALTTFLPSHPFLRGREFAGPAFRDYTLAHVLTHPELWVLAEYLLEEAKQIPTPLFAGFYRRACEGAGEARFTGFVYESAVARFGLAAGTITTIVAPLEAADQHLFSIVADNPEAQGAEPFDLALRTGSDNPIVFHHRLRNAIISTGGTLVLGSRDSSFELSATELQAGRLEIRASELVVRRYAADQHVAIQATDVTDEIHQVKIDAPDRNALSVNWPGAHQYPWAPYYRPNIFSEELNVGGAFLALRGILIWFRRDKREEFAKMREMIENVVVGRSAIRQDLLTFLLEKGILYISGHLFVLNEEAARSSGINWSGLRHTEPTPELRGLLNEFLDWQARPRDAEA